MGRYVTDNLAKTQPDFGPNHIKNINELAPGMLIVFRNITDTIEPFPCEIIRIKKDNRETIIECKRFKEIIKKTLADYGIIKYIWGVYKELYNQSNYIEKFKVPDFPDIP